MVCAVSMWVCFAIVGCAKPGTAATRGPANPTEPAAFDSPVAVFDQVLVAVRTRDRARLRACMEPGGAMRDTLDAVRDVDAMWTQLDGAFRGPVELHLAGAWTEREVGETVSGRVDAPVAKYAITRLEFVRTDVGWRVRAW